MFARFISQIERRRRGGSAKIAGKETKTPPNREYDANRWKKHNTVFKSKEIIQIKNDYLDSRKKDLGITLDRVIAVEATKATGYKLNAQFVSRFRNSQEPKIQSAYALNRNNMRKIFSKNEIEVLMQGWGR